jgi:hypothetical protein
MRLFWRREARLIEPMPMIGQKVQELQTAKEILAEVFHARPGEVEEMIQWRLVEKSRDEETNVWPEESEEKQWPETFCVSE